MNYLRLQNLSNKLYFTVDDAAEILEISVNSAKVLCSRYVKKGLLVRLKKNFYILADRWRNLSQEDYFRIANFLQVPSYISFTTALSFYGLTTQVQRQWWESACLKRTGFFEIEETSFKYYKLKKELYFGFDKIAGKFIATREKAFLDCIYLQTFGKYSLDISSVDLDKLDRKKIKGMIGIYPLRTKNLIKQICKI